MIYKLSLFTLILLTFLSCGSESKSETLPNSSVLVTCKEENTLHKLYAQESIKIEAQNNLKLLISHKPTTFEKTDFNKFFLYNLFKTEYFWAGETVNTINVNNYDNPQSLIDAIKYKDDRWSFAVTPKVYNEFSSQKSVGIGFSCQDAENGCIITSVRIDSPADKIDLRRGDIIQKINNQRATRAIIYAKGQEKEELEFELLRPNSHETCLGKVTPQEYTYRVVASRVVTTPKNETVGYLRLDSFLGDKILGQLNVAFNNFKKESIQKLVIDLRYNGGGSVDLASKLLDKLVVNREGQTQFTLAWNKSYQHKNQPYFFENTSNALDLKQILFLTTQNSASASELIISAMKPYLPEEDIVIIGDKTHGKPVGMSPQNDNHYYYFLINFVVKNSLGFYDYFEGLPVTSGCQVTDDPFHELGDINEAMLKSALKYIDEGSCQ